MLPKCSTYFTSTDVNFLLYENEIDQNFALFGLDANKNLNLMNITNYCLPHGHFY